MGADGGIEFAYDRATNVRTATYRGVVDDGLLLDAYRLLIARPDFVPLAHDLADLRGLERFAVTANGLRQLGELLSSPPGVPRPSPLPGLAIVATSPVAYGLSRMYEMMTEGSLPKVTSVFTDPDSALDWLLRLPPSTFPPSEPPERSS